MHKEGKPEEVTPEAINVKPSEESKTEKSKTNEDPPEESKEDDTTTPENTPVTNPNSRPAPTNPADRKINAKVEDIVTQTSAHLRTFFAHCTYEPLTRLYNAPKERIKLWRSFEEAIKSSTPPRSHPCSRQG